MSNTDEKALIEIIGPAIAKAIDLQPADRMSAARRDHGRRQGGLAIAFDEREAPLRLTAVRDETSNPHSKVARAGLQRSSHRRTEAQVDEKSRRLSLHDVERPAGVAKRFRVTPRLDGLLKSRQRLARLTD